jgi:hypothetical protein
MAQVVTKQPLLEIMQGGPQPDDVKERIIGYSRPGVGKSRWGLSLTERFGDIAYYAADNNSFLLSSISRSKRDRITVVRPRGEDPTATFMAFCMRDWKKYRPSIGTLVVDTFSKVGMDSIAYSANSGSMDREKHYIVGVPGQGGVAIPNRGDYQAVDSLGKGFLDMLVDKQSDMHIILLCHEDVKIIENVHAVGGPAYPGRQMMEYLPGQFSTVVRLIREQQLIKGAEMPEDVVIAIAENDGKFVAKCRTEDESKRNVMARVVCQRDPINWWREYDASLNLRENK